LRYFLGLGGNLGGTRGCFRKALELISSRKIGTVLKKSSLYLSEPVGVEGGWFINAAIEIESRLLPEEMLAALKKIERDLGRKPDVNSRNLARTIDLDMLVAGDIIKSTVDLTLPHPRMAERRFVLEPLAEIAAGLVHPVLRKTIGRLLEESTDTAQVKKLDEKF